MTRKLFYLIPCLMMAMVTFTGCGDDNNDNDGPTGGVLSAEKSKEKLSGNPGKSKCTANGALLSGCFTG